MKFASCLLLTAAAFILSTVAPAAPAAAVGAPTLIVLDASISMRELINDETKIDIAKRAVRELVESLPDNARLGLVVYGHRKPNDCDDIELLIPPAKLDRGAFVAAVNAITPRGLTPLSAALEFAAVSLDYLQQPATVILVSDGLETCHGNPCATAARLKAAGVNLVVHAVAFDLSARDAKSFACIATATGGRFLQANDAASLKDALHVAVVEAAVAAPAKAPPVPPEVIIPVTIKAAPAVHVSTQFPVTWTGPGKADDYLTIVPKGAPDDAVGRQAYTRDGSPATLTAPEKPGEAEVRYVAGASHAVLARVDIQVSPAAATLSAPEQAVAGSVVEVEWTGPGNENDYVTIVPKSFEDNQHADYKYTRQGSPLKITVPGELGACEVRYVSGVDQSVLGRRDLTAIDSPVTLSAPEQAVAASVVAVTWKGPNNENDYITIVPKSFEDNQHAAYRYTKEGPTLKITAPGELGECEIRYVRGLDQHVLARRDFKTIDSPVTLFAPTEAPAGSNVDIIWTGPNNQGDYITIVPKTAEDNEHAGYKYTKEGPKLRVTSPPDAGACEIRYVRGLDNRVLARRDLTTVEIPVTLTGPAEVTAGSFVDLTWTGPNNEGDYITVVPADFEDGQHGNYKYTREGARLRVTAPIEAGAGEIRYVRGAGNRVVARRPLTIKAAAITLRPPASATAGSRVHIEWTGPNNAGDFITIVPADAEDGVHSGYQYTSQGSPLTINAPKTPGSCEVRYISGKGNKVLARVALNVTAP
jgi:Ca-activated chloride channel family protein